MTDRDAMIAAVCAAPDNDTPRLVFADWLDDTGCADDARWAAFIRAQVSLAQIDPPVVIRPDELLVQPTGGTSMRDDTDPFARYRLRVAEMVRATTYTAYIRRPGLIQQLRSGTVVDLHMTNGVSEMELLGLVVNDFMIDATDDTVSIEVTPHSRDMWRGDRARLESLRREIRLLIAGCHPSRLFDRRGLGGFRLDNSPLLEDKTGVLRRGFVEEITCGPLWWLHNADSVLPVHPLRLVRLLGDGPNIPHRVTDNDITEFNTRWPRVTFQRL